MAKKRGAPRRNQNARQHGVYSRTGKATEEVDADAAHGAACTAVPEGAGGPPPPALKIPSLPDLILDLFRKNQELSDWITELSDQARHGKEAPWAENGATTRFLAAMDLYRQNTATIGRLERIHYAINGGKEGDRMSAALDAALNAMSKELGIRL